MEAVVRLLMAAFSVVVRQGTVPGFFSGYDRFCFQSLAWLPNWCYMFSQWTFSSNTSHQRLSSWLVSIIDHLTPAQNSRSPAPSFSRNLRLLSMDDESCELGFKYCPSSHRIWGYLRVAGLPDDNGGRWPRPMDDSEIMKLISGPITHDESPESHANMSTSDLGHHSNMANWWNVEGFEDEVEVWELEPDDFKALPWYSDIEPVDFSNLLQGRGVGDDDDDQSTESSIASHLASHGIFCAPIIGMWQSLALRAMSFANEKEIIALPGDFQVPATIVGPCFPAPNPTLMHISNLQISCIAFDHETTSSILALQAISFNPWGAWHEPTSFQQLVEFMRGGGEKDAATHAAIYASWPKCFRSGLASPTSTKLLLLDGNTWFRQVIANPRRWPSHWSTISDMTDFMAPPSKSTQRVLKAVLVPICSALAGISPSDKSSTWIKRHIKTPKHTTFIHTAFSILAHLNSITTLLHSIPGCAVFALHQIVMLDLPRLDGAGGVSSEGALPSFATHDVFMMICDLVKYCSVLDLAMNHFASNAPSGGCDAEARVVDADGDIVALRLGRFGALALDVAECVLAAKRVLCMPPFHGKPPANESSYVPVATWMQSLVPCIFNIATSLTNVAGDGTGESDAACRTMTERWMNASRQIECHFADHANPKVGMCLVVVAQLSVAQFIMELWAIGSIVASAEVHQSHPHGR